MTHWSDLVLVDVDGDVIDDEASRIRYLREFRSDGSMYSVFFERQGLPHEEDDASTWGPQSPDDVDWTGFPD